MNALRAILAGLGIAVAAAGLAMIVDPSLAAAVPSGTQVVQVLGLLAGLQAGRILWHRYRSDRRAGTVEEAPETRPAGPTPGAEFDDLASAAGRVDSGRTLRSRRNRLRRRLRRAIVAALGRRRDLDPGAAEQAIEAGTWTDDSVAAALFTDEADVDDAPGLLERSGSGPLTRRANHAAVAVADIVGVETGDFDEETGRTWRDMAHGPVEERGGDSATTDREGGADGGPDREPTAERTSEQEGAADERERSADGADEREPTPGEPTEGAE